MWFQDLFHSPHRGAFHLSLTVLVHYRSHRSLSPWRVVPPASRPITRVGRYSGTPLRAALLSATGLSPSSGPRSRGLRLAPPHASVGPTTPPPQGGRFGLGPVRSPLLRASRLISLPPGTEMFQFPGFASSLPDDDGLAPAGLPHSAISGSPRVCHSPELIAAYHGLHRLRVPRHPPHAFSRLTTSLLK